MIVYFAVLFFTALLSGLAAMFVPGVRGKSYKLVLVFAGAYLFAVTIIHILPEIYSTASDPSLIGAYVIGGFFLQQILEYFSSGAEHGHIHKHGDKHNHSFVSTLLLLVALLIHAFLEGALLAHPSDSHAHHESTSLLTGIVLHKAPAAFALISILLCHLSRGKAFIFLLIFALGSPLGMYIGDYYVENDILSSQAFAILFAVVSGNFLHISTTIVFESSENHGFNAKKLAVALAGAAIAVVTELWF
ncbi:zinc permease [Fulvivirga sp. RKSG066]|uniref:ZIP family metal transporter n=1 Tax=Fulvivirga aurantia TaxID=2529383 RepID=UPI0012BC9E6E|nr:ZIP family metal transporter [Fulvivirga aurantia]MTI20270.1 zinc permease [Fulvivirga aurantia]